MAVLCLLFGAAVGCFLFMTHKCDEYRKLYLEANQINIERAYEIKKYHGLYRKYYDLYNDALSKICFYDSYFKQPNQPKVTDDILDAVKYAVIKSHPDNGGNAEDFVKFQKCYQALKNKQK